MNAHDIVGRGASLFEVLSLDGNGITGEFKCIKASDSWDKVGDVEFNLTRRYHPINKQAIRMA